MKLFVSIIFAFLFVASGLSQTLIINDNFEYSIGTLTSNTTNWIEDPIGSTDIQVVSGSLSYSGYPSSGVGNKIVIDGGATGRSGVSRSFTPQSTVGTTVYFSFLLKVTSTTDMDLNSTNGDYFFNFQNSGSSVNKAYIYVRQGTTSSLYNIGIAKSSSTSLTWYSSELNVATTYLVVVSYSFLTGTSNDAIKLWINPSLSGTEPTADITITTGTDATDIGIIQFRQNQKSGDMEVDGLRVSDSWSEAPMPVELTSFTAKFVDANVMLNWLTETEVNNYGFNVERSVNSNELRNLSWENIGFVEGNGNSNSPKKYFFIDDNVTTGLYAYRLKQFDNDGQFEYSKIVEININVPNEFSLEQNYPNPFNPTTTIRFSIPQPGYVSLIIYNILGEQVAELVNDFRKAGKYSVEFDAENTNSGIYFYKLEAGGIVQVRKMALTK